MERCGRRFGDAFTLRFPPIRHIGRPPLVFLSDPDAIRDVFTADGDALRAGRANRMFEGVLGKHSLLVLDGDEHASERRLVQPPFHGDRMQVWVDAMRAIADQAIDAWRVGEPFPLHRETRRITLEIILRTVFGIAEGPDFLRLRDRLARLLDLASSPLVLLLQIDLGRVTPWGRLMRLCREVDDILLGEIARRRATGGSGRTDVLSLLLEARDDAGRPMSDRDLRDEMLTLLIAGHETTASGIAWALYAVLAHPPVLARVREELDRVVGRNPLAAEHVPQLEYLDAVVRETLRLHVVIPMVARWLEVPRRIGGWDLPAGAAAIPCAYLAHRRPAAWPDPERFAPERFLGARPSPYVFFPFGGGPRRCVGMPFALCEMKVVLAEVLSRAAVRLAPGYAPRRVWRGITFAPSAGMPLVLDARRP
jgi:cytochrome P450